MQAERSGHFSQIVQMDILFLYKLVKLNGCYRAADDKFSIEVQKSWEKII